MLPLVQAGSAWVAFTKIDRCEIVSRLRYTWVCI